MMRGFLKMSALSAVLSFTLVTAYNQAWSSPGEPVHAKIYHERWSTGEPPAQHVGPSSPAALPSVATGLKGERLATRADCVDQTWPYIAPTCLAAGPAGSQEKRVRMITIEAREGKNTSVLVRVPQAEVASR
jgi:hypothetical protein